MPALSLADQLFVLQGDPINDFDFTKGRSVDIWIAALGYEQAYPTILTVTSAGASSGAVTMNLSCPTTTTLYRNDILNFTAGAVIVRTTTTITAAPTAVPLFAIQATVAAAATCKVYQGMTPLMSAKEGAFTAASASYAEAHNKDMGLYAISQKIREDYTATITGDVNYGDPCLAILRDIKSEGLSRLFVQARYTVAYSVGGSFYGAGTLGEQYKGQVSLSTSDTEAGMVSFSLEVKVSGKREKYILLV